MRSTTQSRLQMVADVQQGRFTLQVRRESGRREPVPAVLVPVAPHITVDTFAVHRGIGECALEWTVSSVRSGYRVTGHHPCRASAIHAAHQRLATRDDAALQSALDLVGA